MKFELGKEEEGKPVYVTAEIDEDGDIEVRADDIIIFWIGTSGVISTRALDGTSKDHLEQVGFKFDDYGSVFVE